MMPDVDSRPRTMPGYPAENRGAQPDDQRAQQAARDPIVVIRPYMVDLDPKVRANAAAALAVVSTDHPAAAGALVDMWIAEHDPSIVEQIERDLAGVGREARTAIARRLDALDEDPVPERRDAARYCRGRLRLRGIGEGDKQFLDAMIDLATDADRNPQDAWKAAAALARLTGDEMQMAAGELRARLHSPHDATRDETYALLGRLRTDGSRLGRYATIDGEGRSFPRDLRSLLALARNLRFRISTASSLARDPVVRPTRRPSVPFAWTVTGWAAAGAFLMSIHLAATLAAEPPAGFYAMYVIAVLLSSLCLTLLAVRRVSPIHLHYDRAAAAIQQAGVSAAWVFGPSLVGVGILLASASFSNHLANWVVALLAAPFSIGVFVAVIRVATILGFGAIGRPRHVPDAPLLRRIWHSRRIKGAVQTLVGASCGILTATALLWLARRVHPRTHIDEVSRLIEGLWLFVTPTAGAIAAAFSSVDQFPIVRPEEQPLRRSVDALGLKAIRNPAELYHSVRRTVTPKRVTAAVLLVPLGIALAMIALDVRRWTPRVEMAPAGQLVTALQSVTELPVRRDFRAAFPQRVSASIPEQQMATPTSGSAPDLSMVLIEWTASGVTPTGAPDCTRRTNRRVLVEHDVPRIDAYVGWGCYSVEVGSADPARDISRFSFVSLVLDSRALQAAGLPLNTEIPGREHMDDQYTLKLDLNSHKGPSTKNAEFGSRSSVQLLDRLPSEQKLIVRHDAAVLITASPQTVRAPESPADTPIPDDSDEPDSPPPAAPGPRRGEQLRRLELLKGSDLIDQGRPDEPTIERVLEPGEYTVRVAGPGTGPSKAGESIGQPIAINVLAIRRPENGTGTAPRHPPTLTWSIPSQLPATYEFEVPTRQTVAVEIPAVYDWAPFTSSTPTRIRYSLELRRLNASPPESGGASNDSDPFRRVLASSDREQIIQRVMDAGRYRCIVSVVSNSTSRLREVTPNSPPRVTVSLLGNSQGPAGSAPPVTR